MLETLPQVLQLDGPLAAVAPDDLAGLAEALPLVCECGEVVERGHGAHLGANPRKEGERDRPGAWSGSGESGERGVVALRGAMARLGSRLRLDSGSAKSRSACSCVTSGWLGARLVMWGNSPGRGRSLSRASVGTRMVAGERCQMRGVQYERRRVRWLRKTTMLETKRRGCRTRSFSVNPVPAPVPLCPPEHSAHTARLPPALRPSAAGERVSRVPIDSRRPDHDENSGV
ncbi:hypothetical protein AcV7_002754 [Taiwanofungus camphoratus]|nr:hypothetical protein AcV7_002754 [Antrodia cinnamomea]